MSRMNSSGRSTVALVTAVSLFAAGLILGGVGITRVLEARAAQGWPKVPGHVKSSELEIESEAVEHRHFGTELDSYRAKITYEYVFEGRTYLGDRACIDPGNADLPGRAHDLLNRFPADSDIEVHVNPKSPTKSVLDPSLTSYASINPILGLVLVVAGAGTFFFTRQRARTS